MIKIKKSYDIEGFNIGSLDISYDIFIMENRSVCGAVIAKINDKALYMPILDWKDDLVNLVKKLKYKIEIANKNEMIAVIDLNEEAYLLINRNIGGEIREWIDALYVYRRLMKK